MIQHPENPDATKAFELVKKGQRGKAVAIITKAGYQDPEHQVDLIEGFIKYMTQTVTARSHDPYKD